MAEHLVAEAIEVGINLDRVGQGPSRISGLGKRGKKSQCVIPWDSSPPPPPMRSTCSDPLDLECSSNIFTCNYYIVGFSDYAAPNDEIINE
jgi:hypothetical protein